MNASRPGRGVLAAFSLGLALHILFLVSLPFGFLNPLYVEASEGLGQASDFFGIYQAGANLVHGYSIYDSDDYHHEAPLAVPFYYYYRYLPPTAFAAGLASLVLKPWAAYWAWAIVCELLVLAVVLSILRWTVWPADRRYLAAALWLGFFPFYVEQVMGQFSIVMAVFLWLIWRHDAPATGPAAPATLAAPSGGLRERLSGVYKEWRHYRWKDDRLGTKTLVLAWSASVALKSFSYLLIFPYLRDRRFKLILGGSLLATAVSAPYFLFRPSDLREFVRLNFTPFAPRLHKGSLGLHTLLRDITGHLPFGLSRAHLHLGGVDLSLPSTLLYGAFLAILVLALLATLRAFGHRNRAALDLSLWTTAFLLIFKSVWEYHYVMLLPAVTALYLTTGSRAVLALGVLLGLPTLYILAPALAGIPGTTAVGQWPRLFQLAHFSVKSLPTLALFLWCVRETGLLSGLGIPSLTAPIRNSSSRNPSSRSLASKLSKE